MGVAKLSSGQQTHSAQVSHKIKAATVAAVVVLVAVYAAVVVSVAITAVVAVATVVVCHCS